MQRGRVIFFLSALFFLFSLLPASGEEGNEGNSKIILNHYSEEQGLVVHEWGVRIFDEKNVLASAFSIPKPYKTLGPLTDLPKYYDEIHSPSLTHKPVLYFHNPKDLNLDIEVGFADSIPYAWFPDAKLGNKESILAFEYDAWNKGYEKYYGGKVGVIPGKMRRLYDENQKKAEEIRKYLDDKEVSHPKLTWKNLQLSRKKAKAPKVLETNWVATARQTDAMTVTNENEEEKFVFYDGIGHPESDLNITLNSDGMILRNMSCRNLLEIFVVGIGQKDLIYERMEVLESNDDAPFLLKLQPKPMEKDFKKTAYKDLLDVLEKAGLYRDEAEAMAKIWRNDLFAKKGLRVFFLWDQEKYNEVFPLWLSTKPDSIKRVMIEWHEVSFGR